MTTQRKRTLFSGGFRILIWEELENLEIGLAIYFRFYEENKSNTVDSFGGSGLLGLSLLAFASCGNC